nr:MAG TPA: hypothetical protein [Caudoviricetes sp.]
MSFTCPIFLPEQQKIHSVTIQFTFAIETDE